jgi:spore coat protein U-like protein
LRIRVGCRFGDFLGHRDVRRSLSVGLLLACALAADVPLLRAQGQPAQLGAAARVEPECSITTAPLKFGAYNPIGANKTAPLVAEGIVLVQCTKGMRVTVALGPGGHASGRNRAMTLSDGSEELAYQLFQDSQRSVPWTETSPVVVGSAGLKVMSLAVYGRIPAGQDVAAGTYKDSVVVTVSY